MSSSSQPLAPPPNSSAGGIGRLLVGVAGALVGFFGVGWAIVWLLDAADQRYSKVELDVVSAVHGLLDNQSGYTGSPRLVYLGDSLSMPSGGRSIAAELRRILNGRSRGQFEPKALLNVSAPGLTAFSHYLLSEDLAGLGADRFVISVNLGWFSRGTEAQQPSLVGLLPVSRWPEAVGLPLHEIGISADEIVTTHGLIATGQLEPWRAVQREQVRLRWAATRAGDAVQAKLGAPGGRRYARQIASYRQAQLRLRRRPTEYGARLRLGPVLDGLPADDPTLAVLDALVRRLRATGARVLLLIPPTNVDALESLGVYDRDGMETSLGRIGDIAAKNGADFLDLHFFLPDAAFKDPMDHLDFSDESRPAQLIASQLVLWSENEPQWDRFRPDPDVVGRPISR